jgi:hypothetical protein
MIKNSKPTSWGTKDLFGRAREILTRINTNSQSGKEKELFGLENKKRKLFRLENKKRKLFRLEKKTFSTES